MTTVSSAYVLGSSLLQQIPTTAENRYGMSIRKDRWVILVVLAIGLILAVGMAVAWWITCQNQGAYPALDMPSFNNGGTWKAYCKP